MISIKKVPKSKETRISNKKRGRFLLTVGDKSWHITRDEVNKLQKDITNSLGILRAGEGNIPLEWDG